MIPRCPFFSYEHLSADCSFNADMSKHSMSESFQLLLCKRVKVIGEPLSLCSLLSAGLLWICIYTQRHSAINNLHGIAAKGCFVTRGYLTGPIFLPKKPTSGYLLSFKVFSTTALKLSITPAYFLTF